MPRFAHWDRPMPRKFRDRAKSAAGRPPSPGRSVTIAIIDLDLDRFKQINELLGDRSGDTLLNEIERRLGAQVRKGDFVARLGGDQFGLVLRDLDEPERTLHRLRDVIRGGVEIDGLALTIDSHVGFVNMVGRRRDVDVQLRHAEVALSVAKAQHADVVPYSRDLEQYGAESVALVAELGQAIANDQMLLHYQPQVDPVSGRTVAVEALLRWAHPEKGLIPPGQFLPLAEETEVIEAVTDWVLRRALSDLRHLDELGFEVAVAINVSGRTIVRTDFTERVLRALAEEDLSPRRLSIDVTEKAMLADRVRATNVLSGLTAAGVGISLDDFGRGQTSLGYLSMLPVNRLKIDRSLVTDMNQHKAHGAIVRSMIDLGQNLGMDIVAEGVETSDVLATLQRAHCNLAQGFHIARPMPVDDLFEWLRGRASFQRRPLTHSAIVERSGRSPLPRSTSRPKSLAQPESSTRRRSLLRRRRALGAVLLPRVKRPLVPSGLSPRKARKPVASLRAVSRVRRRSARDQAVNSGQ